MAMMMMGLGQAQAGATPDSATMMTHYHDLTSVAPHENCQTPANGDIVVCGGGKSDQRLPLPDERGPVLGPSPEPARADADCLAATGRACAICPPTGCTGVNLLAIPFKVFRIVQAIVDPEH
ncbi:MAG: hypothetical protein ACTHM8_14080 [Sphingomonas sp.]